MVNKALKSEIKGLVYNNELLGFRVKSYNIDLDTYGYYDFDVDIVKNVPDLYEFFKSISKSLKTSQLREKGGRLYTREELLGDYEAQELMGVDDVVSVLKPVILLYKGGYVNV